MPYAQRRVTMKKFVESCAKLFKDFDANVYMFIEMNNGKF